MLKKLIIIFTFSLFLLSCSFVSLDKSAQNVQVIASKSQLENCKYLGDVTTSLWDKANTFQSDKNIEQQLEILALNKASAIGGNVILAKSAIKDNQRTFGVYKCGSNGANL